MFRKYASSKHHYSNISIIHDPEIKLEGRVAYESGVSPDFCPYLSRFGDNAKMVADWMVGWGEGYREDSLSGWSRAWNDGLGMVLDESQLTDIDEEYEKEI